MQEMQRISQLVGPVEHLLFPQEGVMTARFQHQVAQIVTWHEVHHQVIALPAGEKIGYFGQVGVIETRKHSGLAQELFAGLF